MQKSREKGKTDFASPDNLTHVYPAPSGRIIIIRNVPGRKVIDENGVETNSYKISTAAKIQKLVKMAMLKEVDSNNIVALDFDSQIASPDVDMEVRFSGRGVHYGQATVKVWKKAFDRLNAALNQVQKVVTAQGGQFESLGGFPVTYIAEGSIRVGIRDTDEPNLFGNENNGNLKTLEIISQTARWLQDESAELPVELAENTILLDAALKAVEELSPTERDEISDVDISPLGKISSNRRVILNHSTRVMAIQRRVDLAVRTGGGEGQEVICNIMAVSVNGTMKISNFEYSVPKIESKVKTVKFSEGLFDDVVDVLRSRARVKISGIRRPQKGRKYDIEIMALERLQGESASA